MDGVSPQGGRSAPQLPTRRGRLHGAGAGLQACLFWLRPEYAFDWPILVLLALGLLSLTASADVRVSLRELRTVVVEPMMLYFLVTRVASRGRPPAGGSREQHPGGAAPGAFASHQSPGSTVHRLALALLGGAAVAAAWGLFQYAFTTQVITAEGGLRRLIGPYPSPNALGLLLERALPLALALALAGVVGQSTRGERRRRSPDEPEEPRGTQGDPPTGEGRETRAKAFHAWPSLLLGVSVILVLALLLTFSVGAWAGAAVGCGLVVLRQPRRLALGLVGAALVAGLLALPLLRTERVVSHLDLQSVTTSAVRVAVWQSALDMVRDHPLQGVGLDGFLQLYRSHYIRPEAWREPALSHPHNLVLEAWLSLGILGPPTLLWLLGAFFWRAHRFYQTSKDIVAKGLALGMVAGLAAGVVHGLVDRFLAGAPDLSAVFFLFLACVAVLETSHREEVVN